FVPAADIAHDQRLDDSVLANRLDQLFQDIARKIFPGLQWTRHDAGETDPLNFFARFRFETNGRRPGADQRAETFAESGFCHARQIIGSGSHTQTALVLPVIAVNVRAWRTKSSHWDIPPTRTTPLCFTRWRNTKSICAVIASNIDSKTSK